MSSDRQRQYCRIVILGGDGKPQGCGFVVDPHHAFTCAHVVATCLPEETADAYARLAAEEEIVVQVLFTTPNGPQLGSMKAVPGKRFAPSNNGATGDICLLEGDVPAGVTWFGPAVPTLNMAIAGVGMSKEMPDGYPIRGTLTDMNNEQFFFLSTVGDNYLQIEEGCSGGAMFEINRDGSASSRIAGMIGGYVGQSSGRIIPADRLAEVWPDWAKTRPVDVATGLVDMSAARRVGGYRIPNIDSALMSCDRQPQLDQWFERQDRLAAGHVSALMCAIIAREDDLPDLCELRIRQSSFQQFFDSQPSSDEDDGKRKSIIPVMVQAEQFKLDGDLSAQVRRILAQKLRASSSQPAALIGRINSAGQPIAVRVAIKAGNLATFKTALISGWTGVIEELVTNKLEVPIIIFLAITFDASMPDDALSLIEQELEEMEAKTARFANLGLLSEILLEEHIESWVFEEFSGHPDGHIVGEAVQTYILGRADGVPSVRLKTLKQWLKEGQPDQEVGA